jgi:RHS repeat-associated protein
MAQAADDGAQLLEERPGAGTTHRYVYGPGIDRPLAQAVGSAIFYFVADHLGSITQVTDGSGAPTLSRDYDPWGNLLQAASTNGYAFTGREWDAETGLAYYRARYYSAGLGRFLSEDPIGLNAGLNVYRYVSNRPVALTDPLGLKQGPFTNADDCARAALNEIWLPCQSLRDPWEYYGSICKCKDGSFDYTPPQRGRAPNYGPDCAGGRRPYGIYHCHPPDTYWQERFSGDDNLTAVIGKLIMYLVTSKGKMYKMTTGGYRWDITSAF